ncbi:MAG: DUF5107 domain-containing protein [Anaerolineae bacterium]
MKQVTGQRFRIQQQWGIVAYWVMLLWLLYAATACRSPSPIVEPSPSPTPAPAHLHIEALPIGSVVYLYGEWKGYTPLSLVLCPGEYEVRIQHDGYEPWLRLVALDSGQEMRITARLRDIVPPVVMIGQEAKAVESGQLVHVHAEASDNEGVTVMRLFIDGMLVSKENSNFLDYLWDTRDSAAGAHDVAVEAEDEAGNVGRAGQTIHIRAAPTPLPSATPQKPTAAPFGVKVYETTITLLVYPYEPCLKEKLDARYNFQVLWLDRAAYEATNPQPQPRTLTGVVLENQYLKLTFLPELGGRLYQCVFKPSGKKIFYENAVLKPSYWGPLSRAENWWLAAGGMEWALPVHEHGYEWGLPWTYRIERSAGGASILLRDYLGDDRLRAEIRVTLPADRAYFVVEPRLVNPTSQPIACQFWLNAALTLGSASVSPNTEFIYPTRRMIVHSTGDHALPGEHQVMSWPTYDGRDLSFYRNWYNWLGVFVPEVEQGYAGAYNHDTELGIVRIFAPEAVPGLKLFAFGKDFPARGEYTDNASDYFEMWAGPCKTFWPEDDVVIGAGQVIRWSEIWLPFSHIGGLDQANAEAVVKTSVQGNRVRVGIAVSKAQSGQLQLKWNGQLFCQEAVHLAPEEPLLFEASLPAGAQRPGQLGVLLHGQGGTTLLQYEATF